MPLSRRLAAYTVAARTVAARTVTARTVAARTVTARTVAARVVTARTVAGTSGTGTLPVPGRVVLGASVRQRVVRGGRPFLVRHLAEACEE
ncbi:hypothetical protein [Plantactinospora sp. DSM 117369]